MACDKCREEMGLSPEFELAPEYGTNEARDFEFYPELFPELETETPSASPLPNRNSREYVAWVQTALNHALGFHLKPNGLMDRLTRRAILIFQRRNCMNDRGVVDSATEAALKATLKVAVSKAPMFFGLDTYVNDGNVNPNWVKAGAEGGIS